jgi:16S rRNA (uracil1498-N3)-methyltransferase
VPRELTVFVGAEGGFSPAELGLFEAQGFTPVTMGSLVLRVETACIAILSIIQFEFDLLGS